MDPSQRPAPEEVSGSPEAAVATRNPYLLSLWGLTAVLFAIAVVVKINGGQQADEYGVVETLFGAPVYVFYNLAAFILALLGVLSLMCTLVCHAFSPRRTAG